MFCIRYIPTNTLVSSMFGYGDRELCFETHSEAQSQIAESCYLYTKPNGLVYILPDHKWFSHSSIGNVCINLDRDQLAIEEIRTLFKVVHIPSGEIVYYSKYDEWRTRWYGSEPGLTEFLSNKKPIYTASSDRILLVKATYPINNMGYKHAPYHFAIVEEHV